MLPMLSRRSRAQRHKILPREIKMRNGGWKKTRRIPQVSCNNPFPRENNTIGKRNESDGGIPAIHKIKECRKIMASNKNLVPEAREGLNRFKMEAANEVGVNLKQGYNGDLTSKQAGSIGGQMVKKMIQQYENGLK